MRRTREYKKLLLVKKQLLSDISNIFNSVDFLHSPEISGLQYEESGEQDSQNPYEEALKTDEEYRSSVHIK